MRTSVYLGLRSPRLEHANEIAVGIARRKGVPILDSFSITAARREASDDGYHVRFLSVTHILRSYWLL